jgi:hypothetical protein
LLLCPSYLPLGVPNWTVIYINTVPHHQPIKFLYKNQTGLHIHTTGSNTRIEKKKPDPTKNSTGSGRGRGREDAMATLMAPVSSTSARWPARGEGIVGEVEVRERRCHDELERCGGEATTACEVEERTPPPASWSRGRCRRARDLVGRV